MAWRDEPFLSCTQLDNIGTGDVSEKGQGRLMRVLVNTRQLQRSLSAPKCCTRQAIGAQTDLERQDCLLDEGRVRRVARRSGLLLGHGVRQLGAGTNERHAEAMRLLQI